MPKNKENQSNIPSTPFGYIFYISRPFKVAVFWSVLFIIFASGISQASAYAFKVIVEAVEKNNHYIAVITILLYPGIIFVSQTLYRAAGHFMREWILSTMKYSNDILTEHLLGHSHAYFSDRFTGSLVSKVSNASASVDVLIREMLWTHLSAIVTLLVTLFLLSTVDGTATLTFIALIISLIAFNQFFAPKKAKLSKESAEANTKFRGGISDLISNIQAVRQYARSGEEMSRVEELSTNVKTAQHLSWEFSEKNLFYNGVILFLYTLGMFWILLSGWNEGRIPTSDLVLVLSLYSYISGMLMFIGRAISTTAKTFGELEEALGEILINPEIIDSPNAKVLTVSHGGVSWKGVGFEFGENKVFANFNLEIPAGQRVGLVGHSGAGKTTFVSLLLRQHDVTEGEIQIDGQNIAEVTQDSLRQAVAVVPQEPLLFHRSIRDNIAYGKSDATEEEIIAVAKKAKAHDFITQLEHGYDTLVGERGVKLSGGQKQRVAIARAMLKNAPILVLDEATSALDSESEVAIQTALHELMVGKTVVAIAHRLSTLREMDRIIVLENGRIIEDGTHDSLKEAGGVYQRLWEHQAGGFLVE